MSAGSVMGKVVAELLAGRRPSIDVRPFAPSRFA
jgi:glycine/D-amino acid oxidase-like deaminating enzyme